jgi:predicted dehydrogenase/lysophospholipase L1-like esterase
MGLENYAYEISKGFFYYLDNADKFDEILHQIQNEEQANVYNGYVDVETVDFLNELLEASEYKRERKIVISNTNLQDALELEISETAQKMYHEVKSGEIKKAVEIFYELRLLFDQTENRVQLYSAEQDRWMKEAKVFRRHIQKTKERKYEKENIIMIGDSLGLPRPIEAIANNFGIDKTSTFMFNDMAQDGLKMRTWGQRYLTTEKLLDNWNLMVENIQNKHLVIHLGLNDSAERIFLEGQRLALDVYDDELKNSIVEFAKQYRKEIIENQYDHAYVGYEKFKSNVHEIIRRAGEEEAKSITFVNIIAFPKSHEIDTPGSLALTAKYNAFFEEIKSSYPEINLIDLNGIVNHIGFEKCMLPDNMHLSPYGHQVLAKEIFYHLTQSKEPHMYKIAIIGVGQLGSRHLQGLKKISVEAHIELVEPFEPMRQTAMERYNELPENENIASVRFCNSINELSDKLDLVIVATNSDVRAKVLKELIEAKTVKNLVLEKVLFQDINDYDYFERAFEEKNIKAWVNHPRREFAFYDQFLGDIRKSKSISYHVQGTRWGLASNGLHFLDHLLFLSGQADPAVSIEKTGLCDYVEESKRAGFYEIFGSIVGKIGNATFCLTCDKDIDAGSTTTITILTDNVRLMIDDYKGRVMYAFRENGWEWNVLDEKIIYFQSELTGKLADRILSESTCRLPTYHEAALLHKPFITVVKDILESNLGRIFPNCPIS